MNGYKHIEETIGRYIGGNYKKTVEVGFGGRFTAASIICGMGGSVLCTDIRPFTSSGGIPTAVDDIDDPDISLYKGSDCIYAIRPGIEMIPGLLALAERVGSDLLVYHLGNEIYENGGEIIDCGVILHRYYASEREER
ncbi:MAG: hypothetical protein D5R99_04280 [Methanocalculus sp. MSAO_Arc1]|uniref:UPF0146 family protein n=1 Tax=Methanocalculus TaxID=71151 RepID=UPI000FF16D90|nr:MULTISPECIES: UPF0146 family protein [unclassified Methanocalculus]MCP1663220.1 uncharacterized UPF0146 family protein [Methanocalculus sp. AMF5]RQD80697.1 MAG: hypothetical protein D5R99_04280 [Methanocalculus sp. MSAO_Arc1]